MEKKLFIPRKLSDNDSRYSDWNNSQPIKDGKRINQYDSEGRKQGYWEYYWNGQLLHSRKYKNDRITGLLGFLIRFMDRGLDDIIY